MINIFDNFFQDEVLDSSYFYSTEKVVFDNSRLNLLCDKFFLHDTLLE